MRTGNSSGMANAASIFESGAGTILRYGRISLMWFLNEIQSGMAPEAQGAKVMTHWKPRLQLVAAVMVYEILLSCTYIYFITPVFQYTGFVYYPLPLWRMLLVYSIAL